MELLLAHMAASIGQQKARSVIADSLAQLGLAEKTTLPPADAEKVLEVISAQPGLVGIAAKVTRQMVKLRIAPLKPAF